MNCRWIGDLEASQTVKICMVARAVALFCVLLTTDCLLGRIDFAQAEQAVASAQEVAIIKQFAFDVENLGHCIPRPGPYKTLVFGLDRESNNLTEAQISSLKTHVDSQLNLHGQGDFQLDNREINLRIYSELEKSGADRNVLAEKLLNETEHELLIFISPYRRESGQVSYSLIAYSAKGQCAVTPEDAMSYSFPNDLEAESLPVLLSNFSESVVARLKSERNDKGEILVDMCPVDSIKIGNHACSRQLQDMLISALTQPDGNVLGSHNRVSPALIDAAVCKNDPNPTIAMTIFPGGNGNQLNVTLQLSKRGRDLSAKPPTEVYDIPAGCIGSKREQTLLDEIFEKGIELEDKSQLAVSSGRASFSVGDAFDVRISTGGPLNLYCLVIGPDNQANVLMPGPSSHWLSRAPSKRAWKYPEDFRINPFPVAQTLLFGCFGSPKPLPKPVDDAWTSQWCIDAHGNAISRLIDQEDLLKLLEETRATGAVESYTWLNVSGPQQTASNDLARDTCLTTSQAISGSNWKP